MKVSGSSMQSNQPALTAFKPNDHRADLLYLLVRQIRAIADAA